MTFTYLGTLTTDLDRVRFWLGDTDEASAWLTDETITALLASQGSVGGAVIAGLQYIIRKLSTPNFRADWLQVDNATARAGYEKMLAELRREFGLAAVSASAVNTYRLDSDQTAGSLDYDMDGIADA